MIKFYSADYDWLLNSSGQLGSILKGAIQIRNKKRNLKTNTMGLTAEQSRGLISLFRSRVRTTVHPRVPIETLKKKKKKRVLSTFALEAA